MRIATAQFDGQSLCCFADDLDLPDYSAGPEASFFAVAPDGTLVAGQHFSLDPAGDGVVEFSGASYALLILDNTGHSQKSDVYRYQASLVS